MGMKEFEIISEQILALPKTGQTWILWAFILILDLFSANYWIQLKGSVEYEEMYLYSPPLHQEF